MQDGDVFAVGHQPNGSFGHDGFYAGPGYSPVPRQAINSFLRKFFVSIPFIVVLAVHYRSPWLTNCVRCWSFWSTPHQAPINSQRRWHHVLEGNKQMNKFHHVSFGKHQWHEQARVASRTVVCPSCWHAWSRGIPPNFSLSWG